MFMQTEPSDDGSKYILSNGKIKSKLFMNLSDFDWLQSRDFVTVVSRQIATTLDY